MLSLVNNIIPKYWNPYQERYGKQILPERGHLVHITVEYIFEIPSTGSQLLIAMIRGKKVVSYSLNIHI